MQGCRLLDKNKDHQLFEQVLKKAQKRTKRKAHEHISSGFIVKKE
jgi:hypothetical protein